MLNHYEGVIILEDDLFVSPNFYHFTRRALDFTEDKDYLGGISLYNHEFNVHANENFSALDDGYDNWYFQFASSWGQAWSKKQWSGFKVWYENDPEIIHLDEIPQNVRNWSSKSWLKYYIAYLIAKNKFFLYPRVSLTTNFSDVGTHVGLNSTAYQVPLDMGPVREYRFSELEESCSVYDAFYENTMLWKKVGIPKEELTVDLYGYKSHINTPYLLTNRILNNEIIASFGCQLKPRDINILTKISGTDIHLYNLTKHKQNPNKTNKVRVVSYNLKYIRLKDAAIIFLKLMELKFLHLMNKFKI